MTPHAPETKKAPAVFYGRVSSKAQTKRGDGLGSQRTRCEEYARYNNLELVAYFEDDTSGKTDKRDGFNAMIAYLVANTGEPITVIIDDVSRLARSVKAHIALRDSLSKAGGILVSPTLKFDDDADSELQEYLLATVHQHQRRKNAEQTYNRMRARLQNGYWCFQAPVGYRFAKADGGGKMLVRDEPLASYVQEGLEGFANNRFETQAELMRYWQGFSEFPKDQSATLRNQRVTDILTRVIYAGYVESPKWNVSRRKGNHDPLISLETFDKIQERLSAKRAVAPARKDNSADFPLRGFIACGDCGTPLTACWSKARNGTRHPYYLCPKKGCASYGKSTRRADLEGAFDTLLGQLMPSRQAVKMVEAMLKTIWQHREASAKRESTSAKAEIKRIEREIDQTVDRLIEITNPRVTQRLEERITKLEHEKLIWAEKVETIATPKREFGETLRTALAFLANPQKLWASDDLADKQTVLKLTFAKKLRYTRKGGLRTPELSSPFKLLDSLKGGQNSDFEEMVHRGGFEPPAP